MEVIDFFKYKELLAELEGIKGTKKPIHDFIKKVYKLSNEFQYYNKDTFKDQPDTCRYAFILVTKALTYDSSVNSINQKIKSDLCKLTNSLISRRFVSADNMAETFEFYSEKVYFCPYTLDKLIDYIPLLKELEIQNITLSIDYVDEFRIYNNSSLAIYKYMNNLLGPDNVVSKILGQNPFPEEDFDKLFKKAEQLLEINKTILKDSHEHNSTSSEEHY